MEATMLKWYQLEEFPNHEINKKGQVKNKLTGNILTAHPDKDGYFRIVIWHNKKQFNRIIHRLLAQTFIPNPNNYPQINHIDGNKQNNSLKNLEWCSLNQNRQHAYNLGLQKGRPGLKHHNCTLTEKQVKEIRKLYKKIDTKILVERYKVTKATIGKIGRLERWRHIK